MLLVGAQLRCAYNYKNMQHISNYLAKYRLMLAARDGVDTITRAERMGKRTIKRSKYKTILQRNYDGTTSKIRVLR